MINKVLLIGNLGRDPEVRKLDNGASVAKFSVATNENYRDKAGEWQTITEWHNVVAWRGLAERAEKQLKKGSMVYVEGKLTTRKWQDQNGNDRYSTDVVALQLRSLERRESSSSDYSKDFPSVTDEFPNSKLEPASNNNFSSNANGNASSPAKNNLEVAEDDDLPF